MSENDHLSQLQAPALRQRTALGILAVFITEFVSFVFINARNIAMPVIINSFDGMSLFSWLIALPAVAGAASTLLFGKLSDIFGRRNVLLLSIGLFLAGLGISAVTKSMTGLVAAATFMSIGHFPIVPLCFTAIGDLFPPAERAKWTGMLSLPNGIAALSGPVLGGLVAESALGWRAIYWGTIPLMLIGAILVAIGLPNRALQEKPRIDLTGTAIMVFATTSLFVGFSWLGTPGKRWLALVLLVLSLAAWITFILIEKKAAAPILDPHIFRSRPFMTAAGAGFLAYFGLLGIVSYSPIFVQNVMKIDPTINGSMLTPYYTIAAFMGIPVGLLLAKTKKFKWIYLIGYSFSTLALFVMWQFTKDTPTWLYILVTTLAGLGIGSLGTVNVLVAQFSVPKHLLGAAVGAINFFQMVGIVVAPAVLGLVQNQAADLQSGMKLVFLVGALTMLAALVLIATIPHVSIEREE
jgi:MFS family permease